MNCCDYQDILNGVFRHFVLDGQLPGIIDSEIFFHQCDSEGRDHLCAIGLFDTEKQLDQFDCPVTDLPHDVLAKIFGVSGVTDEDVAFLQELQESHDRLANDYEAHLDIQRFRAGVALAVLGLAKKYDVRCLVLRDF